MNGIINSAYDSEPSDIKVEMIDLPGLEHEKLKQRRANSAELAWDELIVKGKGFDKKIIKGITGSVPPGTLLAIMGSSGAGKSTLMNVLAGRNLGNLAIEGSIKVNGINVGSGMSSLSAYVQQDDIFIGSMTVKEHLIFHAALQMSKHSKKERAHRVEEVITEMGLIKCADTVIGIPGMSKTISGGEMKRLSFATEILTDPPIIFCDEPTSGLDSYLAETVIRTLRTLSLNGTTILCTIHQPSSQVFDLFNRLLLLAQGKIAYLGETKKAPKFFDDMGLPIPMNYNPCDHYIHHIALVPGFEDDSYKKMDKICSAFNNSKVARKNAKRSKEREAYRQSISTNALVPKPKPGFGITLFWLLWRAMISHYRDTTFAVMKIVQNLGTALFIGLLFLRVPFGEQYTRESAQTVTSAIFVMVTSYSMTFLFMVLMAFPLQVPVIRREHYGGHYTILAAFLAESIAGLPFFIVMPLFYTIIIYCMCGFAPDVNIFFWCYLTNVLVATACTGYGYFISALARNVKEANTLAPALLIPLFLLSGFFIPAKEVPVYFIPFQYISWFYYGVENLVVNQWLGTPLCVGLNLTELNVPIPDDCFHYNGTIEDITLPPVPPEFSTGVPLPPGVTVPTIEWPNLEDAYDDFINSLPPSCLSKDDFCPASNPIKFDGVLIIDQIKYEPENFMRNGWMLFTLSVAFRILAYAVLAFRFRPSNR